ncbi:metallocarboxypeptidase, partial [Trypanosoma conorhini]
MQAYKELEQLFTKLYRYGHLFSLATWDARVMMPPKGAEARAMAVAELNKLIHAMLTKPRVRELLDLAEQQTDQLDSLQRGNLREMRRAWQLENMLPGDFVERKTVLTTKAQQVWKKCRAENNFEGFLPTMKQLVELYREEGKLRAGNSGKHPYEALVDLYEPGMTLQRLDEVFSYVKSWLPGLLKEVQAKQKALNENIVDPKGPFPVATQEALGR